MKRDSLFFELFRDLPRGFFEAIGRPDVDVSRYELTAPELKESSVRLDGVFVPRTPADGPVYLWEAQWYASNTVYANLVSKIGRFLEHGDPTCDWRAVVLYPSRTIEQKNLEPYDFLLDSKRLIRVFLDELPQSPGDSIEIGILRMIAAKPDRAMHSAQELVPRVNATRMAKADRRRVLQFIETVIVYQFPKMSREEVESMIQVTDFRETRVFQEALEEGLEKGLEKGREEGREEGRLSEKLEVARRLLKLGHSVAEVATITELSVAKVRSLARRPRS